MFELVSVIIPTFNERGHIVTLLKTIHAELSCYPHELIVVDDASHDGTFDEVERAQLPYVRAIKRTEKPGLAFSILCGIKNAHGDALVIMDSDFNHDPCYIPVMLTSLKKHECVVGSRFVSGGGMRNRVHWWGSRLMNDVARIFLGRSVTDYSYGFLCFRREILSGCPLEKIFYGFGDYSFRLLYLWQQRGVSFSEIPVQNGKRRSGVSKANYYSLLLKYVKAICLVKSVVRVKDECWEVPRVS